MSLLVGVTTMMAATVAVGGPARAQGPLASGQAERLEQRAGLIEGKLTRVDGRSGSVDVSIGLFGLLGKTLEVSRDTLIEVNGRQAQFADLAEGAKVKAYYQERGARLVATRLEVSTGGS
jgi:hypothetical protein